MSQQNERKGSKRVEIKNGATEGLASDLGVAQPRNVDHVLDDGKSRDTTAGTNNPGSSGNTP